MIKSQQSEDEDEGFFKPQQKVIQSKQPLLNQITTNPDEQEANGLVNQARPNDFQARIITYISLLKEYPDYLMQNICQQAEEQLISLPKNLEKLSKKYVTLQQKYRNTEKYKMVYSKLKDPKEFGSYIFSLEALTDYDPNHYNHYVSTNPPQNSQNPQKQIKPQEQNQTVFSNAQSEFVFDSNFQSGNLLYAFQNTEQTNIPTFDLIIQNDTNTKGYNQWFYFSIAQKILDNLGQQSQNFSKHGSETKTLKINIVNFIKKHLMFEDGVRPVGMYESEGEWKFLGRQTDYKKSYIKRYIEFNGSTITKNYYTLSFVIDFPINIKNNQKLYLALNYPYPYKRAIFFVDKLVNENRSEEVSILKQTLCHTISNNQVPYLIIASKSTEKQIQHQRKIMLMKRQKEKEKVLNQYPQGQLLQILDGNFNEEITDEIVRKEIADKKKKILVLARQHPGQTVGSFVLQGFLQHLMDGINQKAQKSQQGSSEALQHARMDKVHENHKKLLKEFSIYVFPMINVDGVIYGNFRTNIAGSDLNRQWIQPNKWLHPEIYNLKKFVSELKNIQFVLDFHGHSRKLNSFIYACNNPVPTLLEGQDQNDYPSIHMFRLYPYIMSKECDLFSIKDCTYTISRDKIKTARINTFKNLNYNPYVFTFQTGFFGYTKGQKKLRYKIQDFFSIGKGALQSLKIVLLKPKKVKQILKEVQNKGYLFDKWTFQNKQDPGSESNPSEDQLNPVQKKAKVISNDKIREKQKGQSMKLKPIKQRKNVRKKQKNKRFYRKVQTQLKSQRAIIKIEEDGFKFINESKQDLNDEKLKNPPKMQKMKPLKIEYLHEKKKNTSREMINAVMMKQAIMQKVEFQLPQPNYRERVIRVTKKQRVQQDFKSASNLLGTGLHNFQNRGIQKIPEYPLKTNPATVEMLQVANFRRDIRIQSFSSGPSYDCITTTAKQTQNTSFSQNSIKDLFFSLCKPSPDKPVYSRQGHQKERIYVIRQNKIVKIVNNVNKQKSKSALLENEIKERHNNLKKCQAIMETDNKILIDEIKEQKNQEKKKKRVYLNPIQY